MLVPPDGRVSCELTLLPYNACAAAFTVGEYHAGLLHNGQCSEPHRACSCFSPTVWDDRYGGRLRDALLLGRPGGTFCRSVPTIG